MICVLQLAPSDGDAVHMYSIHSSSRQKRLSSLVSEHCHSSGLTSLAWGALAGIDQYMHHTALQD